MDEITTNSTNSPLSEDKDTRTIRRKVFFLSAVTLLFFAVGAYEMYRYMPQKSDAIIQFEVWDAESARSIAKRLSEAGVIRFPLIFELYARVLGVSDEMKAGRYAVHISMNGLEAVRFFSSIGGQNEITVTIPEGWTTRDIADELEKKEIFPAEMFLNEAEKDFSGRFAFLKNDVQKKPLTKNAAIIKQYPIEGYLFPDTYRFFHDATPEDVIQKMLGNFDSKLTQNLRNEVILQKKKISDIIILASLLEREVITPEDKALVSGILWKRLQIGIPLQVDATIVFIKTGGFSRLSGNEKISRDDLKIDSPYNTYLYAGLPSGPISNPGVESIEAALFPKQSKYFYYLSAPDGKTIFSKTLDEHNAAKAKYLR